MIKVNCIVTSLDGSHKKSKFEYSTHNEVMLNNMYENTFEKIKNQNSISQIEVLAFCSYHVAKRIRELADNDEIELGMRDFLLYDTIIDPLRESSELAFEVITDRYPKKIIRLFLRELPKLVD